ncbi:AAA domain-containing protein [Geosporobacter subterraneus DSM 17957]|uniref:Nuclease SbcCD subunit C n=1 Tax=Geosporobacter subterraneus DSM 17957 TaxID=1121919 RepID=A0A1M6DSR1_9FIRM|nr:AAA family ATPase [Geosporobacter subterraneus]SHI76213.1 AAA domain-containing protein [Geosporobacter subterraneus DSM 17957]
MKLIMLTLRNFKGIKHFVLNAFGGNVNVYGDNATGKTTVFDGFNWLLFDKDSQNKKDFEIKTLDQNGQVLHNLEHEVEGVFEVNGSELVLKKVYSEKWTKKRGSVTQEFSGHTTDYYIDGVPVKKNEYTDKVSAIVDENIFKLLTSPAYFNEQIHWQDRRKTLLEICGDISDAEVIEANEKLKKLPEILKGRKIEDHRKVIAARRTEINKELERIPVRIDEANRSLPDISDLDAETISSEIKRLKEAVQDKQSEIIRVKNGGQVIEKQNLLRQLEGELLQLKNELRGQIDLQLNEKRRELNKSKESAFDIQGKISNCRKTIEKNKNAIQSIENELPALRSQWAEIDAKKFEYHDDCNCPTCGQSLPESKIEEAREKALAKFNQDKSEKLEKITATGKTKAAEIEKLKAENIELEEKFFSLGTQLADEEKVSVKLQDEMKDLQKQVEEASNSPAIIAKIKEIESVKSEIETLKANTLGSVQVIEDEISELEAYIDEYEAKKARLEQFDRTQKRIDELKQQEKELAKEFERLENELYLTEEFIRAKVSMLEERINSKFQYARFKLFDVQINGGVVECCETTYQGVPYSSGLNNAARINVGLDIINTLSEYYGFSAPIFIDNRESVTKLIETKGQQISLIVSEQDKELRVEVEGEWQIKTA